MSQVLLRFLVSPCRVNLARLPIILCLGGFLIIQIKYLPGMVDTDQFYQLNQIEEGIITDWHSPVMTYTWKLIRDGYKTITGTTIIGNGILWALYNLQLWIGLFLVLRSDHFLSNKAKYKSCFFVVLILLASLWLFRDLSIAANSFGKDLGFIGAYLMATGLLLNFPKNKQYQLLFAFGVLFFLFYGTAMRHNAVFAVAPLLCWFVWAMLPKKNLLMIISIGFVLWVLLLTGLHCVNNQ